MSAPSARIESLAHTIRKALHFPPTPHNMDTCRRVAEKVAALDGEARADRLKAVIHHMTLELSDFGQHEPECNCAGDDTPHAPDCSDCECGLAEAIAFGVEQSGMSLEPPPATPEEEARLQEAGVRVVQRVLSEHRSGLALVEAAMATHALVAEALRGLRDVALYATPPMTDSLLARWDDAIAAADAALATSALEASGRRFRVDVREVGTCTRCGCTAEVRQPGRPDEFSCTGVLACCACSGKPACVVVRS